MTSEPTRCFVWTWLPGQADPVVAGVLQQATTSVGGVPVLRFRYGATYRDRFDSVSLFTPELPVSDEIFDPSKPFGGRSPLPLHGCLRDAGPDSWGRRVVNSRLGIDQDVEASELTYLLAGGSDRIGALHFQATSDMYKPDPRNSATLTDLIELAEMVEAGAEIPAALLEASRHGTSIGGARPKALLEDTGGRHLIAKFSQRTDTRPVVGAEAVAMLLAARAGLNVAPVELVRADGHDVLLVERFDRPADGTRRHLVSALTILGFHELSAHHASYGDICHHISRSFVNPKETFRELFGRLVMNVCVGNTDDHLRNHAAFWDGTQLELTPAYDIAPQPRRSREANQAIAITSAGNRESTLANCRAAAAAFKLGRTEAQDIIERVYSTVQDEFDDVCDEVGLGVADRENLRGREFLNPYIGPARP